MGAFRASIQTTSHSEPISVTRRIAIIVIYSRSRIPPPSWDLNLGKLCYLIPVNRPPYPTSLNTHYEDPSMAYSSAIPRHWVGCIYYWAERVTPTLFQFFSLFLFLI